MIGHLFGLAQQTAASEASAARKAGQKITVTGRFRSGLAGREHTGGETERRSHDGERPRGLREMIELARSQVSGAALGRVAELKRGRRLRTSPPAGATVAQSVRQTRRVTSDDELKALRRQLRRGPCLAAARRLRKVELTVLQPPALMRSFSCRGPP